MILTLVRVYPIPPDPLDPHPLGVIDDYPHPIPPLLLFPLAPLPITPIDPQAGEQGDKDRIKDSTRTGR